MSFNKLSIPDPCQQNWDNMVPTGNGRHCTSCDKIIVDFSELSDKELIEVLQSTKPHCGRFSDEQMGITFYVQEKNKERKKYWRGIAAAIVAGVLQLSSGYSQNNPNHQKLYPKNLAIPRFPVNPTDNSAIKQEEKKLVNILVQRSDTYKGISGIKILIKELGIEGITETGGTYMFEVTEEMDLNQWVTIKLENYSSGLRFARGYNPKKLRVKLKDLVNATKVIYLEGKKLYSNKRMGVVAYGDSFGERY